MVKKRSSLKDIAQKVGVSTALVSYVLNGKEKEARVGADAAKKIKKAAKDLNYQPNLIARGLKFGKTKTIGLIVADIANSFFATLAKIIEQEAQKSGYTVLFGSSDEDLTKFENLIKAFVNRQVDGLIITPVAESQDQILQLQQQGIPFVLMDRGLKNIKANQVITNNYEASYNAVSLLIKNGYKRIGMLTTDTTLTNLDDRVKGYKTALADNGIILKKSWLIRIPYENSKEKLEKVLTDMLTKPRKDVDALMFANNVISVTSLKIIHELKTAVPDEIAIVGFDQSAAFDVFTPSVTYIKQDLQKISKNAVNALKKAIDGTNKTFHTIIVPATLVKRDSSIKRKL